MTHISPDTLSEESEWERGDRQRRTGVIGNGIIVSCAPYPLEPDVIQMQHRTVCLSQQYPGCPTCPHNTFTLLFNAHPPDPYEAIACPRWRTPADRLVDGKAPDAYVAVERARCSEQPFDFCPSCPSEDTLVEIGASKVRAGWYGRWKRFTNDEDEDG